jgi:hypothetical protein
MLPELCDDIARSPSFRFPLPKIPRGWAPDPPRVQEKQAEKRDKKDDRSLVSLPFNKWKSGIGWPSKNDSIDLYELKTNSYSSVVLC